MSVRALRTATTLRVGQRVVISGKAGSCPGVVEKVIEPDDPMEEIAGAPESAEVRKVMRELGIAQVAFITHTFGPMLALFYAVGDGKGNWHDAQRESLTIRYDPEEKEESAHD